MRVEEAERRVCVRERAWELVRVAFAVPVVVLVLCARVAVVVLWAAVLLRRVRRLLFVPQCAETIRASPITRGRNELSGARGPSSVPRSSVSS